MIVALTIFAIFVTVLGIVTSIPPQPGLSSAPTRADMAIIMCFLFAIFLLLLAILIKINPFW
jgi:hypothetical protein